MADDKTLLRVENLNAWFYTEEGIVKALENVSFSVGRGEILGLVGETGCGKSVTSSCIMRLIPSPPGKIIGGKILFEGEDLAQATPERMRQIRGKDIAMIFQDPMSSLNPVFTVGRQVEEAIRVHNPGMSAAQIHERAAEMFKKVNIPDPERSMKRYPHQFSGGMKQRVMIAMALSCNPRMLIADEPTTALDVSIQAQILSLIKDLQKDFGSSIMLISHDLGVIATMAQKVAVMYAGSIIEYGSVRQIFEHPLHPYTQGLLGAIPRLDQAQEYLEVIPGALPNLLHLPEGCKFRARCSRATERCARERPTAVEAEEGHEVACYEYR
ncbi:ABC transporter ATP-binding protein [Pyramidobacter piscolens]|uniref:ABC transporter, ATP-binding protein n=1 Tax=Pyramidobacter piscolens W5455 TaxID=352165 RepID=A0ABM9ZXL2_9BACT|nr:ABC transporter ATP-binding protein [Pyramidobacter piscolens]EFB91718.1 ABC transporter, ATP-binding protein [Pyramidobacter piscolens W5455]BDF79662.1 ABC transporter ATP-binding protein [Pyramidobacter piscolens]